MANLAVNWDHGFKIGDVVVCVNDVGGGNHHLVAGQEYVIKSDRGRDDVPGYVMIEGSEKGYFPGRFELAKKAEPVAVAKAGDVVIPRVFDGLAAGAPGYHEHMNRMLGVPIEAKELVKGFEGRPWLMIGEYFWPIDALDVVKDGKVIKAARKAIAKKPKVKKPRKLALRRELADKVKESAGVCSYIVEFKSGKRREHIRDVCHARFNGGSPADPVVSAALNMSGHLKGRTDEWKKGFSKFLNYMMNRSPLASTFKTKKASEALKYGIYMNVQENHNLVVMAAVGVRMATEYAGFIPAFMFGLSKGFSEHASWIIANVCHRDDNGKWADKITGGHQITSGAIDIPQMIEKFHTSFGNLRGTKPFAIHAGYQLIANWDGKANYAGEYAYGAENKGEGSITHLFTKVYPAVVKGDGWGKVITVSEDVIIQRLQYFENLLKQVKE